MRKDMDITLLCSEINKHTNLIHAESRNHIRLIVSNNFNIPFPLG
jgi:hypothetical protein